MDTKGQAGVPFAALLAAGTLSASLLLAGRGTDAPPIDLPALPAASQAPAPAEGLMVDEDLRPENAHGSLYSAGVHAAPRLARAENLSLAGDGLLVMAEPAYDPERTPERCAAGRAAWRDWNAEPPMNTPSMMVVRMEAR